MQIFGDLSTHAEQPTTCFRPLDRKVRDAQCIQGNQGSAVKAVPNASSVNDRCPQHGIRGTATERVLASWAVCGCNQASTPSRYLGHAEPSAAAFAAFQVLSNSNCSLITLTASVNGEADQQGAVPEGFV